MPICGDDAAAAAADDTADEGPALALDARAADPEATLATPASPSVAAQSPSAAAAHPASAAAAEGAAHAAAALRVQKRKVALFLAYVGAGYLGMQRNTGCRTIEGDLHEALVAAGGISPENANDFSKACAVCDAVQLMVQIMPAQVVSLKMCLQPGVVERLNAALPPAIRVFGFRRVTNGFDSRKLCDRRRYEYILPAFAFDRTACLPRSAGEAAAAVAATPLADAAPICRDVLQGASAAPAPGSRGQRSLGGAAAAAAADAEAAAASGFVFDDACREQLSAILARFCGTHNFHNYTIKVPASSPAARRYILSFSCTGTFNIQGQQWVRLEVVGQSFMMHQIRRMVGMALAEFRGAAPPGCLELALDPARSVDVPMAPALGLLLHECCYGSYNERWACDGREPLHLSDWSDAVDAFKAERVYPHIAACDAAEHVNALWLRGLTERAYRFSRWGDPSRGTAAAPQPLRPAAPRPGADASAAVVGSQERYGVGGKRKFAAGSSQNAAIAGSLARAQRLSAAISAQVDAEWSD